MVICVSFCSSGVNFVPLGVDLKSLKRWEKKKSEKETKTSKPVAKKEKRKVEKKDKKKKKKESSSSEAPPASSSTSQDADDDSWRIATEQVAGGVGLNLGRALVLCPIFSFVMVMVKVMVG